MRFTRKYRLNSTGSKHNLKPYLRDLKRHKIPAKIMKLKSPIGMRTHGLYYRPIDLRTRKR